MVAGHAPPPAPSRGSYPRSLAQLLLLAVEPQAAEALVLKGAFDKQLRLVVADNGADALLAAGEFHPDVVLAAANLDDIGSDRLVSTLRRHRPLPVIIGAGPGDGPAASAAMQAGATVCVSRPYRIPELEPLVHSLRPTRTALPPVKSGPVRLDPESQRAFVHGAAIDLPLQEFHLLHLLMMNRDRVLTREQIRQMLWPGSPDERSNTITVHIRRLRLRLGDDAWHPTIIATVRGMGYRFTGQDDSAQPRPEPID